MAIRLRLSLGEKGWGGRCERGGLAILVLRLQTFWAGPVCLFKIALTGVWRRSWGTLALGIFRRVGRPVHGLDMGERGLCNSRVEGERMGGVLCPCLLGKRTLQGAAGTGVAVLT